MNDKAKNSLLYLDGVTVSFDGFRALNDLSLVIEPGEMRAIIGPNGAGKTTMMDVVTGKTRPDSGDVYFDGSVDLSRMDEAEIAELGIGRKFQKPTVFESHTVEDNLSLALAGGRSAAHALFALPVPEAKARIDELLALIRLSDRRHMKAAALSHGQKQWLEIGMLLAQEPKLLLVDEPVAGMTDAETEETAELLRSIAKQKSVVVVEHDMAFVRALGVKVTVLHEGWCSPKAPSTTFPPTRAWSKSIWGGNDARRRERRPSLRRRAGAPPCLADCRDRQGDRADGAERRRQDELPPCGHGRASSHARHGLVRRNRTRPHGPARSRAPRHRLRSAGSRHLPAADRARESRDRVLRPAARRA
jgi:urea transport system ATP-binding protein